MTLKSWYNGRNALSIGSLVVDAEGGHANDCGQYFVFHSVLQHGCLGDLKDIITKRYLLEHEEEEKRGEPSNSGLLGNED